MKCNTKWLRVFATTGLCPLFAWSCSTELRDAAVSGLMDFVSGTVTETLAAIVPVASTISGG